MRFTVQGREYDFDDQRMLVREARELKHHTGLGLRAFGLALQEGDPDALVGMLYLAKRRAGEACRWNDFDDLNLADLKIVAAVPAEDPAEEADAGDPPLPAEDVHTGPPVAAVDYREPQPLSTPA